MFTLQSLSSKLLVINEGYSYSLVFVFDHHDFAEDPHWEKELTECVFFDFADCVIKDFGIALVIIIA